MNTQAALTEAVYYILLSLASPRHGYGIMQETERMSSGRVKLAGEAGGRDPLWGIERPAGQGLDTGGPRGGGQPPEGIRPDRQGKRGPGE